MEDHIENDNFCDTDDLYEEYELPRSPSGSCSSQSVLDLSEILEEQKRLASVEVTGFVMLPEQNEKEQLKVTLLEEPFAELQQSKGDAMTSQLTIKCNDSQSSGPSTSIQFVNTDSQNRDSWDLCIEKAIQQYPDLDKMQDSYNVLPEIPVSILSSASSDVDNVNTINMHHDQIKFNQENAIEGTENVFFEVDIKHTGESQALETLGDQTDKNSVKIKQKIFEVQAYDQMQVSVNNFDAKKKLLEQGEATLLNDPLVTELDKQIKGSEVKAVTNVPHKITVLFQTNHDEDDEQIDSQLVLEIAELEALGIDVEVPIQDEELKLYEEKTDNKENEIAKGCGASNNEIKMAEAILPEKIFEENNIDSQDSQEIRELETLGMEIEVPFQDEIVESEIEELQATFGGDQEATIVEEIECFPSDPKMKESHEVKVDEENLAEAETNLLGENSDEEKVDTQDLHEINELEDLGLNVAVPVQEEQSQNTEQEHLADLNEGAQGGPNLSQAPTDKSQQISVSSQLLNELEQSCEKLTQKIKNKVEVEEDCKEEQSSQSTIQVFSTVEIQFDTNSLLPACSETEQSSSVSDEDFGEQNLSQAKATLTVDNLIKHNHATQQAEKHLSQKNVETCKGDGTEDCNMGQMPSNKVSDWLCDALSNSACDSTPTQENQSQVIAPVIIEGLLEDSITADSGVAADDPLFPDEACQNTLDLEVVVDDMDYIDDIEYDDRDPYLTPSQHPSLVSQLTTNNNQSEIENLLSLSNSPKDQELKVIAEMLVPNQPFLPFSKIRLAADAPMTEATLPDESVLSEISSTEATLPDHFSATLPSKSSTVQESSATLITDTKVPLRFVKSLFTQTDTIQTYNIYTQTSPQADVAMDAEVLPGKKRHSVASAGPSCKLACLSEGPPTARKSERRESVSGGSLGQNVPKGQHPQPVRQSLRIGLSRRAKLNNQLHKK